MSEIKLERCKRMEAWMYSAEIDYECVVNGVKQSIPLSQAYFSQRLSELRGLLKPEATEGEG